MEALSIEDTTIETEDSAKEALELEHPAVLMEQYLVIYLRFSKREGWDQMSPVGKTLISQTQAIVGTMLEGLLFKARHSSIKIQY